MATPTYTLIEEQVLGSSSASVTLGSGGTIPQTYTHLVIECVLGTTATNNYPSYRFNGDTGTNYSFTQMYGDGTNAYSNRFTSSTSIGFGPTTIGTSLTDVSTHNIMSYTSTSVYKTAVGRYGLADGGHTAANAGLWRSTAAITSITVNASANSFMVGSTFRLWGIA